MTSKRLKDKKVPNLRFPGFEEEWETKKLEEICKMQAGKFISASEINDKKDTGLFPCYGGNGLRGYVNLFNRVGMYSLIGRQGALCGNVNLANGKFYATEHAVVAASFENINTIWMFYLLNFLNLNQYSTGMAQPGLSIQNLEKIETKIPNNIIEQKKIGSLLSVIDERISTQNKIIEELEQLIKGICQKLFHNRGNKTWSEQFLEDVLEERKEINTDNYTVHSVSVSKGVINQIEYLGRSFAAKDTTNYNVVHYGDIVYTKSPTGEFPYGIIKQSFIKERAAVSPLYGVFRAKNFYMANILHFYFSNPINVQNYLQSIIQKGAKNTISITNQNFLKKKLYLPIDEKEIKKISSLLSTIESKKVIEMNILEKLQNQKKHLLHQMFI
ncbi:restriction endonuclease subunit S [Myroides odoratimimus]|uniref:restriction endonuclease subunit S n=1 Tax=Myroides odoratimimus TaxID=76832 RepID=UPI0025774F50|nr:restriction endonuclease subunit S [Myroides odoratimimus]MDM1460476.1 restriction endonuclease subunit S [Myroides odoratimimus]